MSIRRRGSGHAVGVTTRRVREGTSAVTAVVVLLGLVITAALAWAAEAAHDDTEDRLTVQRTRAAAAVLSAALPSIEAPLATTAALPAVTDDADDTVFEQAMGPRVGPEGQFSTAAVWPVDGPAPAIVLGDPPAL